MEDGDKKNWDGDGRVPHKALKWFTSVKSKQKVTETACEAKSQFKAVEFDSPSPMPPAPLRACLPPSRGPVNPSSNQNAASGVSSSFSKPQMATMESKQSIISNAQNGWWDFVGSATAPSYAYSANCNEAKKTYKSSSALVAPLRIYAPSSAPLSAPSSAPLSALPCGSSRACIPPSGQPPAPSRTYIAPSTQRSASLGSYTPQPPAPPAHHIPHSNASLKNYVSPTAPSSAPLSSYYQQSRMGVNTLRVKSGMPGKSGRAVYDALSERADPNCSGPPKDPFLYSSKPKPKAAKKAGGTTKKNFGDLRREWDQLMSSDRSASLGSYTPQPPAPPAHHIPHSNASLKNYVSPTAPSSAPLSSYYQQSRMGVNTLRVKSGMPGKSGRAVYDALSERADPNCSGPPKDPFLYSSKPKPKAAKKAGGTTKKNFGDLRREWDQLMSSDVNKALKWFTSVKSKQKVTETACEAKSQFKAVEFDSPSPMPPAPLRACLPPSRGPVNPSSNQNAASGLMLYPKIMFWFTQSAVGRSQATMESKQSIISNAQNGWWDFVGSATAPSYAYSANCNEAKKTYKSSSALVAPLRIYAPSSAPLSAPSSAPLSALPCGSSRACIPPSGQPPAPSRTYIAPSTQRSASLGSYTPQPPAPPAHHIPHSNASLKNYVSPTAPSSAPLSSYYQQSRMGVNTLRVKSGMPGKSGRAVYDALSERADPNCSGPPKDPFLYSSKPKPKAAKKAGGTTKKNFGDLRREWDQLMSSDRSASLGSYTPQPPAPPAHHIPHSNASLKNYVSPTAPSSAPLSSYYQQSRMGVNTLRVKSGMPGKSGRAVYDALSERADPNCSGPPKDPFLYSSKPKPKAAKKAGGTTKKNFGDLRREWDQLMSSDVK
uniref:Uncharacterized protein n=1 Tax=Ditylenchus dipsaci TaxID=166011 RepID=A0A915D0P3_9BILA